MNQLSSILIGLVRVGPELRKNPNQFNWFDLNGQIDLDRWTPILCTPKEIAPRKLTSHLLHFFPFNNTKNMIDTPTF